MPVIAAPLLAFATFTPGAITKITAAGSFLALPKLGSATALVGKGASASSLAAKSVASGKVFSSKGLILTTKNSTAGAEGAAHKTVESISNNLHNLGKSTEKILHIPQKETKADVVKKGLMSFFGVGAAAAVASNSSYFLKEKKKNAKMKNKKKKNEKCFVSNEYSFCSMIKERRVKRSTRRERRKNYKDFLCRTSEQSTKSPSVKDESFDDFSNESDFYLSDINENHANFYDTNYNCETNKNFDKYCKLTNN